MVYQRFATCKWKISSTIERVKIVCYHLAQLYRVMQLICWPGRKVGGSALEAAAASLRPFPTSLPLFLMS